MLHRTHRVGLLSTVLLVLCTIAELACWQRASITVAAYETGEAIHVEDDLVFFHVSRPKRLSYVYRGLMAKDFGGVFTSR